jgi:hypothetical protein
VVLPRLNLFRLRQPSLLRGVLLALGALAASLCLAGLPFVDVPRASSWQILLAAIVFWGMVETARCLGRRWSLYHAGVLILLYSELMILAMVLFFWVYL